MQLTCPSCGARHSIEAALNDEAAREVVQLAAAMHSAAVPAIAYLGLFRPAKHSLRWARARSLMRELSGVFHANMIRRRGRDWPIRPQAWVLGLEAVIEARDRGKLRTPLRDHAYLHEVVIGHSERLAGEAERQRDEEHRRRPPKGPTTPEEPQRLDPGGSASASTRPDPRSACRRHQEGRHDVTAPPVAVSGARAPDPRGRAPAYRPAPRRRGIHRAVAASLVRGEPGPRQEEDEEMTEIDWKALVPRGYWRNARGNLVHERNVKPVDRDMDEVVRRVHGFGAPLSEQMWRFRDYALSDLASFAERVVERYGGRLRGRKGNLQLITFDGCYRVNLAQADRIAVGPEIVAAQALVEECVKRWGSRSDLKLRALVDQAFVTGADGAVSVANLLRLRRVEIDDEQWRRAQDAIADALRPAGKAEYIRLYRRETPAESWEPVPLHLATVTRPAGPALRAAPEILERRVRSAIDEGARRGHARGRDHGGPSRGEAARARGARRDGRRAMSAAKYRSDSQQRILAALAALAERPLVALTTDELASRIGCTRDAAYRTLRNLELAGWVLPPRHTSAFGLAPRATRLSEGIRAAFAGELKAYLGDAP